MLRSRFLNTARSASRSIVFRTAMSFCDVMPIVVLRGFVDFALTFRDDLDLLFSGAAIDFAAGVV